MGIIIYALRPSEVGISRDPSCIKGFILSDVAVVPGNGKKFFSQPALSFLHPQSIRGLLLGLSCLLQKLCSFPGLAKLFAEPFPACFSVSRLISQRCSSLRRLSACFSIVFKPASALALSWRAFFTWSAICDCLSFSAFRWASAVSQAS